MDVGVCAVADRPTHQRSEPETTFPIPPNRECHAPSLPTRPVRPYREQVPLPIRPDGIVMEPEGRGTQFAPLALESVASTSAPVPSVFSVAAIAPLDRRRLCRGEARDGERGASHQHGVRSRGVNRPALDKILLAAASCFLPRRPGQRLQVLRPLCRCLPHRGYSGDQDPHSRPEGERVRGAWGKDSAARLQPGAHPPLAPVVSPRGPNRIARPPPLWALRASPTHSPISRRGILGGLIHQYPLAAV